MQVKTVTLQFKRGLLRIWNIYIYFDTKHITQYNANRERQDSSLNKIVLLSHHTELHQMSTFPNIKCSILIYAWFEESIIRKTFILFWNIDNLVFRFFSTNYNTIKLHRKQLVKAKTWINIYSSEFAIANKVIYICCRKRKAV